MAGGRLRIDRRSGTRPGQGIVCLTGSLDFETAPAFLKALRDEAAPVVILDFSGVSFMDSAGVGSLIQTYVSFQRTERKLALAGLSERVGAVLELTRVRKLFPVFASPGEAAEHLT